MLGRTQAIVLAIAVALLVGCADEVERTGRLGYRRHQLQEGIANGDAAAIGAIYLEDAQMIPPDTGEPVKGRAAIQALWQARMDEGLQAIELVKKARRGEGDMTFETGTYTSRNAAGEIDVGNYFIVWQLVDRVWFVSRYTWASDLEGDGAIGDAEPDSVSEVARPSPEPDMATE